MSERPLIEAVNLSKVYGNRHRVEVLRDLSLSVGRGEKVVVVGQSGVGKSTLLHILGALDSPSAGKVLFDGTDLASLDERELASLRNREIGFVFQFHHLLPDFTALENAMMPALIRGLAREEAASLAAAMLEQVGLAERLHHKPGELSGGEQQRVAVARAVVLSPRAVLADEPTGNLDPAMADEVHQLLIDLNARQGITLVIVTHNRQLAELADRTLILRDGRLDDEAALLSES
jgi:lipoprotein-releasing system ATP-binding protein